MIVSRTSVYFVTLILTCNAGRINSNSDTVTKETIFPKSEPSYYQKQFQLLKLFNNLRCWRDWDLQDLSYSFDPLDNLELYKDPELVRNYFEGLQNGQGLGRDEPFANNNVTVGELKQIFLILFNIDDWNLFYKTSAYALGSVNVGIFFWALSTLVSSKYAHEHFRTPPSYEVFPQFFAPKSVIYSLNGLCEPPSNISNGQEAQLNYYQDDPALSSFHLAWHFDFPFWWKPDAYKILKDRKGELFLYLHRQMLNRYRIERLSAGGLEDISPINFDEVIQVGYVPTVLYINFNEISPRLNNSWIRDIPNTPVGLLRKQEIDLQEGISFGYFVTDNGTKVTLANKAGFDIVGSTVEASEQSVDLKKYGRFHNSLHGVVSKIADPDGSLKLAPGILGHPDASARDPAFYRIHTTVDNFYRQQSKNMKPYSEEDLRMNGIELRSLNVVTKTSDDHPTDAQLQPSHLETFFEDFSFDVSKGIKSCDGIPSKNRVAIIRRLNHRPFQYYLNVYSNDISNTTVRIYLSPVNGFDGKPYPNEELFANMIELDRFRASLSPGENNLVRSSEESAVTIPDATPTEQLLQETGEAISNGMRPDRIEQLKNWRHCGYPHNLLLPKGTQEGMKFKLFVILTDGEEGLDYPGLPLCGVESGKFPDKKPMGFPFEREVEFGQPQSSDSYKFVDVIIKHMGYVKSKPHQ